MVYFKVLLNNKRPKSDNIYPIEVRVTYNRQNTTLTTGIRVHQDYWDSTAANVKPKHPNALAYNKTISETYSKIQAVAYRLVGDNTFSFENLRASINGTQHPQRQTDNVYFKAFTDDLIDTLIENLHSGNAIVYRTAAKRLLAYADNSQLRLIDVNYTLLDGFKNQLVKDGVKQNTISNYFRTLRAIYNKAIKARVINRTHYPFLDITVKTERTAKRAISVSDLAVLCKANLEVAGQLWHARNMFLISFCLRGASFTDLVYLKPENILKGRVTYRRRKTGKELSIKLHPFAESLLNHYADTNRRYLLPLLPSDLIEDSMKAKAIITQAIKVTNKYLKRLAIDCGIEDEVTTYVARHTWATIAKRLGYSIEVIAEALGQEYGNKVTNIYLDSFDQSLIDEVNERVISSIQ